MPGPKSEMTRTGLPSLSLSTLVGTNHDDTPGPVAIASQTCSGVPGTSTSTCTDRRPDGSFFTLMMAPGIHQLEGFGPSLIHLGFRVLSKSFALTIDKLADIQKIDGVVEAFPMP